VTRQAAGEGNMVVIVLADTVTRLDARHACAVLVTGSHGGAIAAEYAAQARVRAAIFNDAGGGLDDAGVSGLALLDSMGMAAAAVSHASARIADAHDTLANGVISRMNAQARHCGVRPGMRCADAAERLRLAAMPLGTFPHAQEARALLVPAHGRCPAVVGLDSIGLVDPGDAGAILVVGSHGALHGGEPESALPVDAAAAFFHDAGRGKDDVGVSRLPVLDARGIPAGTVDYRSARIGDARSLWATGRLSCVNRALWMRGVTAGMSVQEAVQRMS